MKTLRIAIVGPSPCERCYAACCVQNGHEFAALLLDDGERRRFRAFAERVNVRRDDESVAAELVIPYVNGRCRFLGDDNRCTIYDDRPRACREFECTWRFNAQGMQRHEVFLDRNPRVLDLLASM